MEARQIGVLSRVLASEIIESPFAHIQGDAVFADFAEIRQRLKSEEGNLTGSRKKQVHSLKGGFWERLFCNGFRDAMLAKFVVKDVPHETDVRLVRDNPGFSLGPHTDDPKKLVSLIFYIEGGPGTSLYVPKKEGFTSDGLSHLDPKDFEKVKECLPEPNSMCGFRRTDKSFHGVELVTQARITLLYNIYRK